MEDAIFIAIPLSAIGLLVFLALYSDKKKKEKRAKQMENYLTYDDLLSWQYSQNLKDEWFISVNGGISDEPKTLLQAKEMKENATNADIQILHTIFKDDSDAEWNHLYIKSPPKENSDEDSATGFVISGFFLSLVSLAIFPPAFGLAAFICGILAMAKNDIIGGLFIVFMSIACGAIGMYFGAAIMSSL